MSDFRKNNESLVNEMFREVNSFAVEEGLIDLSHLMVDGTTIKANGNTSKSVSIEMLDKVDFGSKYVTPRAKIVLSSKNTIIIAEEKKRNRVKFSDNETGDILLYSSPPSRKEHGFFKWLKWVQFYDGDEIIAEIRYRHLLSRPQFIVKNQVIPIQTSKKPKEYIYKADSFEMLFKHSEGTHFKVFDKEFLLPCIGFLHYLWSSKWST